MTKNSIGNPCKASDFRSIRSGSNYSLLVATPSDHPPPYSGGRTYVVLHWQKRDEVLGYNLYRRSADCILYDSKPINGSRLIAPVDTCAELEALIAPESIEWEQLRRALTVWGNRKSSPLTVDKQPVMHFAESPILEGLINPCDALASGLTADQEMVFDKLADYNLCFRLARGLAFKDLTVVSGTTYCYELRGILPDGAEIVLASNICVTAGFPILPDPPSGFTLTAGDGRVLALWHRNPYAFSYCVCRSPYSAAGYEIIHSVPIRLDIAKDLEGNPLPEPYPCGFLDIQRWDSEGLPIDHSEYGSMISGPENGITYYYRVASEDILGRRGEWSEPKLATPRCSIPPMAPDQLRVDAIPSLPGLALSWRKVTRNVETHQIRDAHQFYVIYRGATQSEMEDMVALGTHEVARVTANPRDPTTPNLNWTDMDRILEPPFGEVDFWYRVRCIDQHGSVSAPSAIVSGRIPDTTPPEATKFPGARGYADHITVDWPANSEPDLAGYHIYRGICDRGQIFHPPDLEGEWLLVGTVTLREAAGHYTVSFDDYSVPAGSRLCYAYWIRAYDTAQNLSGNGGPCGPDEYVCCRLREETPPPAPVITALKARSNSVLIEWIAAPIPDLRAFHVYRSELEGNTPEFIGCVLIDGTTLCDPWIGMQPSCEDIPAELDPGVTRASFLDRTAEPNRLYWYRVSALDWIGNESEGTNLTRLPAISTLTYSADLPPTPTLLPRLPSSLATDGLEIRWDPGSDSPIHLRGFVVFRRTQEGSYRQVSPIVDGCSYNDKTARPDVEYWYCVQALDQSGKLSNPSTAAMYRY